MTGGGAEWVGVGLTVGVCVTVGVDVTAGAEVPAEVEPAPELEPAPTGLEWVVTGRETCVAARAGPLAEA